MSTVQSNYTEVNGVAVLTFSLHCLNGEPHHLNEPAWQEWSVVDGRVYLTNEGWFLDGVRHRVDGPAYRVWQVVDGQTILTQESWYLNGLPHCNSGPANRTWQVGDGHLQETILTEEDWCLQGFVIHPCVIRQPVRIIERWWRCQQRRRKRIIESLLWESGMIVFPGFMGLLREY